MAPPPIHGSSEAALIYLCAGHMTAEDIRGVGYEYMDIAERKTL